MTIFFRRLLRRTTLSEELQLASRMVLAKQWAQAESAASGTAGFTRDFSAARRWYEKAGELGVQQALVNLAMMLAFELEPPERDAALLVFQRAHMAGVSVGPLLVETGERLLASSQIASASWALAAAATFDKQFAKALHSAE